MAAGLTRGATKALTQLAKKLFRDAEKTGKIDRTLLDELDLLPVAEGKGTSKIIPEFEWRADPGYEMARDKKGKILNPDTFGKVIQKIPTEKSKVGIMTPSTKISRKVINYLLKEDSEVGKDFLKLKTQNLIKGTDNFIRDGSLRKDAIQELLNQASIQNSPRMTKFLKPFLEKGDKAAKRRSKLSEVLFSKDMNLFEKSLDDPWLLLSDDMKKFTDVMAKAEPERAGPNLKAARLAARKEEEAAGLQRMLEDPEFRAEYEAGTLDPTTMRLIDEITKRGKREFARETEVYGKPYDPKRTEYDESIDLWKKREEGQGALAKTFERIDTGPPTQARVYPEFSTDRFGRSTAIPSEAIGIGGIRRPKDFTLPPEQWRGTPKTRELLKEERAKDLQRNIAEAEMMEEGLDVPLDPTQEQSVLKAENILRQQEFERQLIRDAERAGGTGTQFSAAERAASGKPLSLEDIGPLPWKVVTPDDVKSLSPDNLKLFKQNMEEFNYLVRKYIQQGYSPKNAFRLAQQEMQEQVGTSSDVANMLMRESGIITDEGLPSYQVDDLGKTSGLVEERQEGPMAEQLRQYFDELDLSSDEFKKGGRVKAKKKTKKIPKILQNRNKRGKRTVQQAIGAGAALRGWGAVRRVS